MKEGGRQNNKKERKKEEEEKKKGRKRCTAEKVIQRKRKGKWLISSDSIRTSRGAYTGGRRRRRTRRRMRERERGGRARGLTSVLSV
jgi:hypothetical protein